MSLLLTLLFTIVSYNCENLFDCRHDSLAPASTCRHDSLAPASTCRHDSLENNEVTDLTSIITPTITHTITHKNDYDFLPTSTHHWTFSRYWQKLNNIARVIQQCGSANASQNGTTNAAQSGTTNAAQSGTTNAAQNGTTNAAQNDATLPDIVALLEVENDSTLIMLTRRSLLKGAGYRYVMTDSPDARGIDVAVIYNPLTFRLESSYSIRPQIENIQTRDILYIKGIARARERLHIFVVHAPSRRNGKSATEGYRLQVKDRLMQSVDSIRRIEPDAKIILMGDFNDYSNDKALKDLAGRGFMEVSKGIKGLNYKKTKVFGTYKYQGVWNSLDHIFLSDAVLQKVKNCFIYDAAWLLEEDAQGGYKPFRTYLGPKYHEGVSDHLPIVLQLRL